MDHSPPGSSVHGNSPGKNTGVECHALLQGNLPNPGIEHRSPALQAGSLSAEPPVSWSFPNIFIPKKHLQSHSPALSNFLFDESEKAGLKLNIQKTKIMVSGPITLWQRDGEKVETVTNFISFGSKITVDGDCSHKVKRHLLLGRKTMTNRQYIKKQRHYFTDKGPFSQSYGFSSIHVWMWELDQKEGWAPKNWCFWTVMLEKALESPLNSKKIKLVNPKGNLPWIYIRRTHAEAEAPILWPPAMKSQLIGKDPDAGKDWRQEEKGKAEDEMVGWHHRLDAHEFKQTPETVKDGGTWQAIVHGIAKSQTWLSDWMTIHLN